MFNTINMLKKQETVLTGIGQAGMDRFSAMKRALRFGKRESARMGNGRAGRRKESPIPLA